MKRRFVLAAALTVAAAPLVAQPPGHHDGMRHQMPDSPYKQAEMQMHERMMRAMGSGPAETWVRKMIEHHRGAIEMSQIMIARADDRAAETMARRTMDQQRRDIRELQAWLRRHGKSAQ